MQIYSADTDGSGQVCQRMQRITNWFDWGDDFGKLLRDGLLLNRKEIRMMIVEPRTALAQRTGAMAAHLDRVVGRIGAALVD